jgi:hypothetical protein
MRAYELAYMLIVVALVYPRDKWITGLPSVLWLGKVVSLLNCVDLRILGPSYENSFLKDVCHS